MYWLYFKNKCRITTKWWNETTGEKETFCLSREIIALQTANKMP